MIPPFSGWTRRSRALRIPLDAAGDRRPAAGWERDGFRETLTDYSKKREEGPPSRSAPSPRREPPGSPRSGEAGEGRQQGVRIDRLGQVRLEAGGERAVAVLGAGEGGQRDRRQGGGGEAEAAADL